MLSSRASCRKDKSRLVDDFEITLLSILDKDGMLSPDPRNLGTFILLCYRATSTYQQHLELEILQHRVYEESYDHFAQSGGLKIINNWIKAALIPDKEGNINSPNLLIKICNLLKDKFSEYVEVAKSCGLVKSLKLTHKAASEDVEMKPLNEAYLALQDEWAKVWGLKKRVGEMQRSEEAKDEEAAVGNPVDLDCDAGNIASNSPKHQLSVKHETIDNDRPALFRTDSCEESESVDECGRLEDRVSDHEEEQSQSPRVSPVEFHDFSEFQRLQDTQKDSSPDKIATTAVAANEKGVAWVGEVAADGGGAEEGEVPEFDIRHIPVSATGRSVASKPMPALTSLVTGGITTVTELLALSKNPSPKIAIPAPPKSTAPTASPPKSPSTSAWPSPRLFATSPRSSMMASSSSLSVNTAAASPRSSSLFGIDEGTGLPLVPLPPPHAMPSKGVLKSTLSAPTPGKKLIWADVLENGKLWSVTDFLIEEGNTCKWSTRGYREGGFYSKTQRKQLRGAVMDDLPVKPSAVDKTDSRAEMIPPLKETSSQEATSEPGYMSGAKRPPPLEVESVSGRVDSFLSSIISPTATSTKHPKESNGLPDSPRSENSSPLTDRAPFQIETNVPDAGNSHLSSLTAAYRSRSTASQNQDPDAITSGKLNSTLVKSRIVRLLKSSGKVAGPQIPTMYFQEFKEPLPLLDEHGSKIKLRELMDSIPSVCGSRPDSNPTMIEYSLTGGRVLCRYFNTKFGCRYGDKCAYRHDTSASSPRKRDLGDYELIEAIERVVWCEKEKGLLLSRIPIMYHQKYGKKIDLSTPNGTVRKLLAVVESCFNLEQKGTIGTTVVFVHKDFIGDDKQRVKSPSRKIRLRDDNEDDDDDDLSQQLSTKRSRKE